MRITRSVLLVVIPLATLGTLAAQSRYQHPFQDPELPLDLRVKNVLSLLTQQEKIDLLGKTLNIPRLGIHGSGAVDSIPGSSGQFEGLHGLAVGGPNQWGRRSPGAGNDTSTITTTQFPQSVGLGDTWDPALITEVAAEEAREARFIFQSDDRGGLIVRAPNADLARDPRWGRSEESYGEDPWLTGTLSTAFVHGLQGTDARYWMTASLVKHFLANSNEDNRTGSSSNFDERLLHEYYAVPFRMTIEQGGADAIMTAYNAVNGVPMAASPLLRDLLMQQWGFNGMIDTDRGALDFMATKHHYVPDGAHAAAAAIHAGVNQFLNSYEDSLNAALAEHLITEAEINRNLEGVLRVLFHLGILDPPEQVPWTKIRQSGTQPAPWDQPQAKELALRATEESIVLLKNANGLLPLDRSSLRSVAVIGPLADVVDADGYSGTAPFVITPLQGIRMSAGPQIAVRSTTDSDQAVSLAASADAAILVVGNRPFCHKKSDPAPCPDATEGQEGIDRQKINLEPQQEKLIEEVSAVNRRTVVVLISSFPYTITWAREHVPAILNITHDSEEEGAALGRVLFGDYNPAGRLDVTWPQSLEQLPAMMDYNIRDGRTYMYFRGTPLFPFGFGESYSTFAYSRFHVSAPALRSGGEVVVRFTVTNKSEREGDEVAQMYVQHLDSRISRPKLELAGFKRISVPAGESRTVSLPLTARSLMYWNTRTSSWALERDRVRIEIGASSADVRLSGIVTVR